MGVVLFAGSWMVGLRLGLELMARMPHLWHLIKEAQRAGEGAVGLWIILVASVLATLLGGLMLVFSLVVVLVLEGTQVLVDDLGLAVEIGLMPAGLARRLGAGRLAWKRIGRIQRRGPFFIVEGGGEKAEPGQIVDPTLKFITVDELERLVLMVLERSPNVQVE
jgi:hypothetical protein